jgi:hypothetical protein
MVHKRHRLDLPHRRQEIEHFEDEAKAATDSVHLYAAEIACFPLSTFDDRSLRLNPREHLGIADMVHLEERCLAVMDRKTRAWTEKQKIFEEPDVLLCQPNGKMETEGASSMHRNGM